MFTADTKMADLVHENHQLLSVMNRFGIRLGFGEKSVKEVCIYNSTDCGFFLEIANAFHDEGYFPQKRLQTYSVSQIVDYLKKTHDYYLNEKVPEMEGLIGNMIKTESNHKKSLELVSNFFGEYKDELTSHIKREDEIVFPYVLELESLCSGISPGMKVEKMPPEVKGYSMKKFMEEHDNIVEKLFDLKNIIIKYMPPVDDQNLANHVLYDLFALEKDIRDHSRIEEKIMVPKVVEMENMVAGKNS